ncbi:MAG: zinc metallopeptidase, partial [Alistipes sp.]|nr:zinc metallopeptidase [Alistipes sp.]
MFTLLQSYYGESSSLLSNLTTSEAFFLIIIIAVVGMVVQMRLRTVFNKYSNVGLSNGMTGAEIAAKMLRDHNIHNVRITQVDGELTDHYNPATLTVNLSKSVYSSRSIAAAAVACHECGHAIQHAEGYAPLQLRSSLVPIVNFSSRMAQWIIIIGLILMSTSGNAMVCWIGVGMIAMSALFSIVTLPVEYNASDRALAWLESSRTLRAEEMEGAMTSLRWAARTYLVAALSAIASLLYYIALINNRR